MGFTPAREAKAASLRTLTACDHAVRHFAALIAPNRFSSSNGAASLTLTSSTSCFSLAMSCSSSSRMCLAKRTASVRATDRDSSSSPGRHRETSEVWETVRDLRASTPRLLLRTRAFSALTERVRSALMAPRAVVKIRTAWRIPSLSRGWRSFSTGSGSGATAIWWASKASVFPTPRRFLASMRGASATG
jgi:hypothetical protein